MRLLSLLTGLAFLGLMVDRPVLGGDGKQSDVPAKVKEHLNTLRTSTDAEARERAIDALGKLGATALAPLSEALRDPSPKLREAAARAFGRMERRALAKAVPFLIEAMRREQDDTVIDALVKAVAHAKEAAVPGLIDLALTTTGDARQMAFASLARIGAAARPAVPALIELLTDKDEEARTYAVVVLGRIGPGARAAVPALLKLQRSTPGARRHVIDALAAIGEAPDEALGAVLKGLKDPDVAVRFAAVRACAAFGPKAKAAVPDLIRLLDDEVNAGDVSPRPVVYALGKVGPDAKAAVPKLLPLLKDDDIEHATHAAAALLRIGAEEKAAVAVFRRALDKSLQGEKAYIRFRTFSLVEDMGPAAKPLVPLLLSIVKDEKEDVDNRPRAAGILQKLAPEAVEKIEKR